MFRLYGLEVVRRASKTLNPRLLEAKRSRSDLTLDLGAFWSPIFRLGGLEVVWSASETLNPCLL